MQYMKGDTVSVSVAERDRLSVARMGDQAEKKRTACTEGYVYQFSLRLGYVDPLLRLQQVHSRHHDETSREEVRHIYSKPIRVATVLHKQFQSMNTKNFTILLIYTLLPILLCFRKLEQDQTSNLCSVLLTEASSYRLVLRVFSQARRTFRPCTLGYRTTNLSGCRPLLLAHQRTSG